MKVSCFFLKKPSCETRNTDYHLTLPAVIESSQCSTYFNMTITWPTSDTFKTFDIRETSKWGHFKLINHHPYNNRLEDDMFYKKSVPKIKDIRSFFFGGYIYIYIYSWQKLVATQTCFNKIPWGNDPIWLAHIFSKGLVQPPTIDEYSPDAPS